MLLGIKLQEFHEIIVHSMKKNVYISRHFYLHTVYTRFLVFSPLQGNTIFGAPGSGGQMGYCDPENQLAWAYLTNHMSLYAIGDDPKYLQLETAIYESLRKLPHRYS